MPGTTKTNVFLGPYAWHYKNKRLLRALSLALQKPAFSLCPMPGTTETYVSLGPYAWHYENVRFLKALCLVLQKPMLP